MITRTQLKRELVAERKRIRVKQGESLFLRRTLSIYGAQKKRAAESKAALDYDVAKLRELAARGLLRGCAYCLAPLTSKKFCADHDQPVARGGRFTIENLNICCPSCNWQKGMLDGVQFVSLRTWAQNNLGDVERRDFWRRLTTGGRWTPRG